MVSKERLYEVIRKPIITEKATQLASQNKFVFMVADSATKAEIKASLEFLFKVKVQAVNTLRVKGKEKVFKGKVGKRSGMKKAIVTLAEGQVIDMDSGVV